MNDSPETAASPSLDIERADQLIAYLRATGRIAADERVNVRVLAGGVSNRTVLVERPGGEAWVLKQALAKLRVAVDWFSDPARIQREALGMRWLAQLAPPACITPLIFEDAAQNLLAMQAVPQPHENWKTMLLRGDVSMDAVEQFAALLGAVHRRAAESTEPLARIFDDRSFFESLRLEPYYQYAATQVPAAADFLHQLIADTSARRLTLVHGDFSPKNILVHQGRLILLDHEVIHWGDPAFDMGFALTHLLSKYHAFPQWREKFLAATRRFVEVYAATLGRATSQATDRTADHGEHPVSFAARPSRPFSPSPGTPGEGWGEGSRDHVGDCQGTRFAPNPHPCPLPEYQARGKMPDAPPMSLAVPEKGPAAISGPVYWDANMEAMTVRHTLGCLLARVAGRSPLEYLDMRQRNRQREIVTAMMAQPIERFDDLLRLWVIGCWEDA